MDMPRLEVIFSLVPFNASETTATASAFQAALYNFSGCANVNWCEVSAEALREDNNNPLYNPIDRVVVTISYRDLTRARCTPTPAAHRCPISNPLHPLAIGRARCASPSAPSRVARLCAAQRRARL